MPDLAIADIIRLIPDVDHWIIKEDTFQPVTQAPNGVLKTHGVTTGSMLAAIDKRLPSAMCKLIELGITMHFPTVVSGELVHSCLQHWHQPSQVKTTHGIVLDVRCFNTFSLDAADDTALVNLDHYTTLRFPVHYADGTEETIPIAVTSRRGHFLLHGHTLDESYPGWRVRLGIAQSLDYTEAELATAVFTNAPQRPAVSLDGCNF